MGPKYAGGLRLRDIKLSNLALLARQAWRVLTDPNSLSARILKAKYFATTEFLHVILGVLHHKSGGHYLKAMMQ